MSYLNTRRENTTVARKVTGIKVNVSSNTFLHSLAFLCSLLTTIQKRKTAGRLLRLRAHAFLVEG